MDSDGGKYAARIDLNANDSHALMIRMVGGGKRVLDVGCWTGDMSAELARFNPRVVGIEIDPQAAEQAKKVLDEVVVADVTQLDFEKTFGPDAFDVMVFGDVLEHLPDPAPVLRNALAALAPDGFVVASIPNVAHGSVRLSLLKGSFDYTPTGLLDETHLRFFTRDSVLELFADAGMAVAELQRTVVDPVHAIDRPIDEATVPADLLRELRGDIEAMTYQFIVKAVRDDGAHASATLYERAESLERRLTALLGAPPGLLPDRDAGDILRVGAVLATQDDRVDGDHVCEILRREIATRLHGPVDVRLLEGDVAAGPSGWGPDVVLSVGRDASLPARPHVRSLLLPDDVDTTAADSGLDTVSALGLLASRIASGPALSAQVDLLRATRRFPDVEKVLTVVLADEPSDLVEQLATFLSDDSDAFEGVVVMSDAARPLAARFEALWPGRCVIGSRPVHATDLFALFAGSSAVVSASPFDRAAAAAVGARTADTAHPDDVLRALDRSAAGDEDRSKIVLALDRALDRAMAGLRPVVTDRGDDEVSRLHAALDAMQHRLAEERMLLADSLAELRVGIAAEEAQQLRAELAAVTALLDAQREAVVRLQEDFRQALAGSAPAHVPPRPPFARRVRARLGRTPLGRAKRRLARVLRGA